MEDEIKENKKPYIRFKNIKKSDQERILEIVKGDRVIESEKHDRQGRKVTFTKKGNNERQNI